MFNKKQNKDAGKQSNFIVNKPLFSVDIHSLKKFGVSLGELRKYFPKYILNPTPLNYGLMKHIWLSAALFVLKILVKVFLRPRLSIGNLDREDVMRVYNIEAETYNKKHHLTTRGMDMIWRRVAGWLISVIGRDCIDNTITILDICTGTGLTIKEILPLIENWGLTVDITGLDYNSIMLDIASATVKSQNHRLRFVKGDAMNLVSNNKTQTDDLSRFQRNSFDVVTQIFGIGGISEPLKVFEGVLQILKPAGKFILVDMHRPISELPGEWPFFLKWYRCPIFEVFIYEKGTIPIVLNQLWGWRDTTLCFYFLPLVTYRDEEGKYWGFKVQILEMESQRWWFALPIMPVGKIVVEKTEINKDEFQTRRIIFQACEINKTLP